MNARDLNLFLLLIIAFLLSPGFSIILMILSIIVFAFSIVWITKENINNNELSWLIVTLMLSIIEFFGFSTVVF